jgi:hypothetical protein
MGNCKFCGKPAGFLHSEHTECEQLHENSKKQIVTEISQALSPSGSLDVLQSRLTGIAQDGYISEKERQTLLVQGWTDAVDRYLEDGVLDESEEKRLVEFKNCLSLTEADLDANTLCENRFFPTVQRWHRDHSGCVKCQTADLCHGRRVVHIQSRYQSCASFVIFAESLEEFSAAPAGEGNCSGGPACRFCTSRSDVAANEIAGYVLGIRRFGSFFAYFFGEGAGLVASFFAPLPAFTSTSVAVIV